MSAMPDPRALPDPKKGIITKLTRSYAASSAAGLVALAALIGRDQDLGPRWTLDVVLGLALIALIGIAVYQTRLTRRLKQLKRGPDND